MNNYVIFNNKKDNINKDSLNNFMNSYLKYSRQNINISSIEYIEELSLRMCKFLEMRHNRFKLMYYGLINNNEKVKSI